VISSLVTVIMLSQLKPKSGPCTQLQGNPIPAVSKKASEVEKEEANYLIKNNTRCPVFHGLPKLHKPLRQNIK